MTSAKSRRLTTCKAKAGMRKVREIGGAELFKTRSSMSVQMLTRRVV